MKYLNKAFPHLLHGGDYNPEQWEDAEVLNEDMVLMKEAGCNEMTLGVFSWAALEPEEGKFNFSFLDAAVERVYQNGGRVILATPSGARPRWLAERYPEVMRVTADGKRLQFRDRHNHCYTSPVYREKVAEIDRQLARRYGSHPAVIAWHISNEYGGDCYCPLCRAAFRNFLRERYGDIDTLNRAYWAGFWSLKYDDFGQIEPPTDVTVTALNALYIDWQRFVSRQTAAFLQNEKDAVRQFSDLPVTTNMMWRHHLDYGKLAERLDFVSWDAYPDWTRPEETASDVAFWHDLFRSLKGEQPFLMMESAPGLVNWMPINRLKRPHIDRLQSLQAVAHGSDGVLYFQFRKGRGGREKFHGGIVDHTGTDETRIFGIVRDVGKTLRAIDCVAGTSVHARVAVVCDKESGWALQYATGFNNRDKGYLRTCERYYRALWKRGINVDVIGSGQIGARYDVIVAPMLYAIGPNTAARIADYVRGGGIFYATYMLGMVDENDLCYLHGLPAGELKEVFGIWNEEIDSLYPEERVAVTYAGKRYAGQDYAENVHLRGAECLAEMETDFGVLPALTRHTFGAGKAYYQTFRDGGDFSADVLGKILEEAGVAGEAETLPEGVTLHTREGEGMRYLFLENYSKEPASVRLKTCCTDLENGETGDTFSVQPLHIRILKRPCGGKEDHGRL